MTTTLRRLFGVIVVAAACGSMAAAQDDSLYSITHPGWEKAAFTDGAKIDRVEYVYGDRKHGLLKIKRVRLEPGDSIEAVIAKDTEWKQSVSAELRCGSK